MANVFDSVMADHSYAKYDVSSTEVCIKLQQSDLQFTDNNANKYVVSEKEVVYFTNNDTIEDVVSEKKVNYCDKNIEDISVKTDEVNTKARSVCLLDESGGIIDIDINSITEDHFILDGQSNNDLRIENCKIEGDSNKDLFQIPVDFQTITVGENDTDGETKVISLREGLEFPTRECASEFVKEYCNAKKVKFVITSGGARSDSGSRHLVWSCTYGKERKPRGTGQRPVQHIKKKNCNAHLRFYCPSIDGTRKTCVLASFSEDHNHETSIGMYKQDTDKIHTKDEYEDLKTALDMKVKPRQFANLMEQKYNKAIPLKHIEYKMAIMAKETSEVDLDSILNNVNTSGGFVTTMFDSENKVRCLSIMTADMKKSFLGISPDIVMMDTTYNFEKAGYKLNAISYLNPVTNRGEFLFLSFISDEGAEVYEFIIKTFKKIMAKDPSIIMVDKDLSVISILKKHFPLSTILICFFHVVKIIMKIASNAFSSEYLPLKLDEKQKVIDTFKAVMYSKTQESLDYNTAQLEEAYSGIFLKTSQGDYTSLISYYHKNWGTCAQMWQYLARQKLPNIEEEFTNNRLERLWRSLKDHLETKGKGKLSIKEAVAFTLKYAQSHLEGKYIWDKRHTMRLYSDDPVITNIYKDASFSLNDRGMLKFKDAISLYKKRLEFLSLSKDSRGNEGVKEVFKWSPNMEQKWYNVSDTSCNCSKYIRSGVPCHHILFLREKKNLSFFDQECFHPRFFKDRNQDLDNEQINNFGVEYEGKDSDQDSVDDENEPIIKVLSKEQRYKVIKPLIERLSESICRTGTNQVHRYKDELLHMIENVKQGRSLFYNEQIRGSSPDETESFFIKSPNSRHSELEKMEANYSNLKFQNNANRSKLGRPRGSKVNFVTKKRKQDNGESKNSIAISKKSKTDTLGPLVCSFPFNLLKPDQNGLFQSDLDSLQHTSYISNAIVDYKIRCLQPNGPAGKIVWMMSNGLGQLLSSPWWESPSVTSQLEAAQLYTEVGCNIIFLPWWQFDHFYAIISVLGDSNNQHVDHIFVMESVGTYPTPVGVKYMADFLKEVKCRKNIFSEEPIVRTLNTPKQPVGSNDCAVYVMEFGKFLLDDPYLFCRKAFDNNLGNLFSEDLVRNRRAELKQEIELLGFEQRESISQHSKSVSNSKSGRKCRLCKQVGHMRNKCPSLVATNSQAPAPIIKADLSAAKMGVTCKDEKSITMASFLEVIYKCDDFRNQSREYMTMNQIFSACSCANGRRISPEDIQSCLSQLEAENKILLANNGVYFGI